MFIKSIVVRAKSPVESLYLKKTEIGKKEFVFHRDNDVSLLFNQQRLDKLVGVDTFNSWLRDLEPSAQSAVDKLRSNMTDEQLFNFVKSRHIQSMSELLLWSEYLESEYSAEIERYNEEVAKVNVDTQPLVASSTETAETVNS